MDHQEEQHMEIEALQAILEDNVQEFEGTRPDGWPAGLAMWSISVQPSEDAVIVSDAIPLRAELVFAHTPAYPDEPPLVKARSVQGLSDADAAALQGITDATISESLGMAMIYAIFSAVQDWLSNKAGAGMDVATDPLIAKKAAEDTEEQRLAEVRRLGTPVTPETFAPWKQRFYADLAAAAARKRALDDATGRITGKAFFLAADSRGDTQGDDEEGSNVSDEDIDYADDSDDGMLDDLDGRQQVGAVT